MCLWQNHRFWQRHHDDYVHRNNRSEEKAPEYTEPWYENVAAPNTETNMMRRKESDREDLFVRGVQSTIKPLFIKDQQLGILTMRPLDVEQFPTRSIFFRPICALDSKEIALKLYSKNENFNYLSLYKDIKPCYDVSCFHSQFYHDNFLCVLQWNCSSLHFPFIARGDSVLIVVESPITKRITLETCVVVGDGFDKDHKMVVIRNPLTMFVDSRFGNYMQIHKDQIIDISTVSDKYFSMTSTTNPGVCSVTR